MPTKKTVKKTKTRKASSSIVTEDKSLSKTTSSQEKAMMEVVAIMFAIAALAILLYVAKVGF